MDRHINNGNMMLLFHILADGSRIITDDAGHAGICHDQVARLVRIHYVVDAG